MIFDCIFNNNHVRLREFEGCVNGSGEIKGAYAFAGNAAGCMCGRYFGMSGDVAGMAKLWEK